MNYKFKIQYGEIYSVIDKGYKTLYKLFKIQYGEIYSLCKHFPFWSQILFKIQYGEIYRKNYQLALSSIQHLKSSMERFID